MTFDPLSSVSSSEEGDSASWGASFAAASLASASFASAAICRFVQIYQFFSHDLCIALPAHLSLNNLCSNFFDLYLVRLENLKIAFHCPFFQRRVD